MRVQFTCEQRGFSSIDAMIDAAEIALAQFTEELQMVESGRRSPMESKAADYLKLYVLSQAR